jgi:hypothetical protein
VTNEALVQQHLALLAAILMAGEMADGYRITAKDAVTKASAIITEVEARAKGASDAK